MAERFSAILTHEHPPNLMLLPSFSSQDLAPDGVHLTPVSGLHYVLFLFDQSEMALKSLASTHDQQLASVKESVRQHNDRMAYLESRQVGFVRQANTKVAADAEFDDFMLNRSEEDWLVVQGLPRLAGTRDWQDSARRQVADVINLVLHINRANVKFEVLYVSNPFRFQPTRPNVYNVQMDSVYSSKRIKDLFSGFFRGNRPHPIPPPLKGVSVRNKVTPNTKIRISILHQLGMIFKESNPGGSYQVHGYKPRPTLVTIPPQGSASRQRTYNFMQAVTQLPATFSDEHLTRIFQVVSNQQPGSLESLFVVLNDDDRDRCLELVKQRRSTDQSRSAPSGSRSAPSGSGVIAGSFSGLGAGMDLGTVGPLPVESLLTPPPPPPACDASSVPTDTEVRDRGGMRSRGRSRSPDSARGSESRGPVIDKVKDKSKDKDKSRDKDKSKGQDKSKDKDKNKDKDKSKDEDRSKVKDKNKDKDKSKDEDRSKVKDKSKDEDKGRDEDKGKHRSAKELKRRHQSSDSSSDESRRHSKKGKSKRRKRTRSTSSSSSGSSGSSSSGSHGRSRTRRSKRKTRDRRSRSRTRESSSDSQESLIKTRER